MTDHLRRRIANAVQPLLMDTLPKVIAAARAEAAVARVRALADRWDNALAPDRAYARALRNALDTPEPTP